MKIKEKQLNVKVEEVKKLKKDIFLLSFISDYLSEQSSPGNFIHLKIDPAILRRPFSIHKIKKNRVYILFRVRGRGTKILSNIKSGCCLDIIGPLGRGFDISSFGSSQDKKINILIGGGMGVAPLVFLAQKLKQEQGKMDRVKNIILLGAKNKNELLCELEFKELGCKTLFATDNGSRGIKGNIVSLLKKQLSTVSFESPANVYACGPKQMFKEMFTVIKKYPQINCQVSFEQFMGCGLGFCCGCTIVTNQGYKKVCKDGPVFNLRDVY